MNIHPGHYIIIGISSVIASFWYQSTHNIIPKTIESRDYSTKEPTRLVENPEKYIIKTAQVAVPKVQLYKTNQKIVLSEKEFECLAKNVYWESMHEPTVGQIAVIQTTFNRVKSPKWNNTFCKVVYKPNQFSWTNDSKIVNAEPKNKKLWNRSKNSVSMFMKGFRVSNFSGANHYFADYINPPKWSKEMKKVTKIGKHIFLASK